MKHKILMTLALLITAVGGAWAQTASYDIKEFVAPAAWETDEAVFTDADLPEDFMELTEDQAKAWTGAPKTGITVLVRGFNKDQNTVLCMFFNEGSTIGSTAPVKFTKKQIYNNSATTKYFYATASSGPKVTWDAAKKTGTFEMPAYDVEIAPIYAPVAQWAKVENVDQIPTAIEGIFAGTTDAIVKAGTVAMMGKTENPQGIVMYAVTSINQATAPALSAFSADVPTAENITVAGDVLVWYYIQGANTPDGEEATAENTFNDSEICPMPIKVTVLPNKYDITFKAANDNTIQAGKATVKVGETAAAVDNNGNLTGVKMNSKVTVTAKEGYKFRKAEAKLQGWQRKGMGTITDGLFMSFFTKPDITVHCNVYENVNTPGLYKIDGFQCALVAAFFGISEEEMRQYEGENWRNVKILIDATNPEKVSISSQDYGILVNTSYGFIMIRSEATGKLVDNVITFPSNGMYAGFPGLGKWYYGNVNGTFKIVLPK